MGVSEIGKTEFEKLSKHWPVEVSVMQHGTLFNKSYISNSVLHKIKLMIFFFFNFW